MWVVIVLVLAVNSGIVLKSCRDLPGDMLVKTGEVIDKAGSALSSVAVVFR